MDLATSIDFDSLGQAEDEALTVPKKGYGIDVNRQFDLYTTESITYPAEAPPVYQKHQLLDGFTNTMTQALHKTQSSKSPSPPRFVLRTVAHTPAQPVNHEANRARQSDEVRGSLQLPRAEPTSNNGCLSKIEVTNATAAGHTHLDETTVLCEVFVKPNQTTFFEWLTDSRRGTSMDFAQPDESMPGRMGITKGASKCTIRVTLRKKQLAGGGKRAVRSIWVIADGGKAYIQQKLPQDSQIIPYTLWSNETKAIIRYPTELRYFANANSESPYKTKKTSWVNYVFGSASTSAEFQSALLSPLQLIRTLPTTRTVRLHRSPFVRLFSPRLQLCGLENLRVFQDATDPNCLVCMVHYSPNFRPLNGEEYIVFRLYPPPRNSVRIREDGESCVKIKGLDIRGSPANEQKKAGKAPRSQIERMEEEAYGSHSIEKIKIEFESGKEKRQFLELTRELQGLSSW
ncbi:MAG: hypothetical protein Q9225_006121 [Loekoesia sp. 1 TL-2023]